MFVPISVTEFQKAYATVLHVLSGNLEFGPGVLTVPPRNQAQSQAPEDSLASRAWYMGGLLFVDPTERASFYWRVGNVLPLAQDKKYRKYRGEEAFSLHIALLSAVRGSSRMTKKALLAAFDMEFRLQLAKFADSGTHSFIAVERVAPSRALLILGLGFSHSEAKSVGDSRHQQDCKDWH
jgi:hypothetical protein